MCECEWESAARAGERGRASKERRGAARDEEDEDADVDERVGDDVDAPRSDGAGMASGVGRGMLYRPIARAGSGHRIFAYGCAGKGRGDVRTASHTAGCLPLNTMSMCGTGTPSLERAEGGDWSGRRAGGGAARACYVT